MVFRCLDAMAPISACSFLFHLFSLRMLGLFYHLAYVVSVPTPPFRIFLSSNGSYVPVPLSSSTKRLHTTHLFIDLLFPLRTRSLGSVCPIHV